MLTRVLMLGALLPCLSLLGACSPRVLTRVEPVEVVRVERIPFPPELLAACGADIGPLATNGDLLAAYLEKGRALDACNAQLEALRGLK